MKYDICIIGGGFGGLICARQLAKAGRSVLLLERQQQLGGCIQSYQRHGKQYDTGLHYVGGLAEGQPLNQLFTELGLMELPWQRLDAEGFDHTECGAGNFVGQVHLQRFDDAVGDASQQEGEHQGAHDDDEAFQDAYDSLSRQTLQVESFKDTEIRGTVAAREDGILFTSIPYTAGWKAFVDGKPADVIGLGDNGVVGVPVSSGEHEVTLRYRSPFLLPAAFCSLIGVVLFMVFKNNLHNG